MSTIPTASQPVTYSPLRRLIRTHPLVAFFVLAIAGAWIIFLPVLFARNGLGLFPFSLPVDVFTTIGSLTGPTLAAFIVTTATSGQAGLQQLLHRIVRWRVGIGWYLLVLLGYPFIYVTIGIITSGMASLPTILSQWLVLFTVFLPYLLVNMISTMGEEIGWVGYALPNLQQRFGPLLAVVILGAFWGLMHLPAFFAQGSGQPAFSIVYFAFFIFGAIAARITWTWIFNKTAGSVIIIALLHASSNATGFALIPRLFPVTPPGAVLLVVGLFYIAFPALIIIFTRGRLGYRPDRVPQLVETP